MEMGLSAGADTWRTMAPTEKHARLIQDCVSSTPGFQRINLKKASDIKLQIRMSWIPSKHSGGFDIWQLLGNLNEKQN